MAVVGCQGVTPTVTNRALLAHLPGIDFSGLSPMQKVESVKVMCSVPSNWTAQKPEDHGLYTVQQWKSPTGYTGAGVVHAHLLIPMDAKSLLWLAKTQYSQKSTAGGKELGQWTDSLGRPWFEGENDKYHARGYVIAAGFDAWLVYYGYNLNRPISPTDLNLAARCVDTVVPQTGEQDFQNPSLANIANKSKPQ